MCGLFKLICKPMIAMTSDAIIKVVFILYICNCHNYKILRDTVTP